MSEGMSRRDLIKASAVAGATAWTAPMIIDSLSSPAAAGSIPCAASEFTCSWIYVLYTDGTNYWFTGFTGPGGTPACGGGGALPEHKGNADTCCDNVGFTLVAGTGSGSSMGTLYNLNGCSTTGGSAAVWDTNCASHVHVVGGTIQPIGSITILGAGGFGAGDVQTLCANGGGVCLPTKC